MKPVQATLKRKTMINLANHAINMFNELNLPKDLTPDDTRAVLVSMGAVLGRITQVVVQNIDLLNTSNRDAAMIKAGQQQMVHKLETELQNMGVNLTDEKLGQEKDRSLKKTLSVCEENGVARDWAEILEDRIIKKFGKKVR